MFVASPPIVFHTPSSVLSSDQSRGKYTIRIVIARLAFVPSKVDGCDRYLIPSFRMILYGNFRVLGHFHFLIRHKRSFCVILCIFFSALLLFSDKSKHTTTTGRTPFENVSRHWPERTAERLMYSLSFSVRLYRPPLFLTWS